MKNPWWWSPDTSTTTRANQSSAPKPIELPWRQTSRMQPTGICTKSQRACSVTTSSPASTPKLKAPPWFPEPFPFGAMTAVSARQETRPKNRPAVDDGTSETGPPLLDRGVGASILLCAFSSSSCVLGHSPCGAGDPADEICSSLGLCRGDPFQSALNARGGKGLDYGQPHVPCGPLQACAEESLLDCRASTWARPLSRPDWCLPAACSGPRGPLRPLRTHCPRSTRSCWLPVLVSQAELETHLRGP